MDWDPSAPAEPQRTPAAPVAAPGSRGSDLPAGKRAPKTKKAGAAAGGPATTAKAAPHDPWTRAVEQAPGVWVVGTETNIGKDQASSAPDSTSATAAPAPQYEPATAQAPQAAAVPQSVAPQSC